MGVSTNKDQLTLITPDFSAITGAVETLANADTDDRGAIFTRREVVDFILDLVGYKVSAKLQEARLLEPSFGHGDFLIPAIERLFSSLKRQKLAPTINLLKNCIRGVELHPASFETTRAKAREILLANSVSPKGSDSLLQAWFVQGDFLLTGFETTFTHVVGNPPYIRQEMVPDVLMEEYRRRYETIYDRADIYIPFIEHSLELLSEGGVLGFICADRWMKNKYGAKLRALVAGNYHLRAYVDMTATPAFRSEVIAYPAITVIAKEPTGVTHYAARPSVDAQTLGELAVGLMVEGQGTTPTATTAIGTDDSPWIFRDADSLSLVRRLELNFPSLEEAGCRVGIGVTTGADSVFIAPFESLDVEVDRKLPLAMTKDIQDGTVAWRGYGVVNPFDDAGNLVSLADYPKLRTHFETYKETIKNRHVSKKNPSGWYRTIDRIYPDLVNKPKLLIPDIKGDAHIVYEEGRYYPHHNLYYILSEEWDLLALRSVLLSGIARLFVETYSTKMHGDFLRFQAQYLRRIRVPRWSAVSESIRNDLRSAGEGGDEKARDAAVRELYGLTVAEHATIKA